MAWVATKLREIKRSIVTSEKTIAMQAHSVIKLWQAVSPPSAQTLMQNKGVCLQPSSNGDQFALLKLTRGQAFYAAKAVWARYFGQAAVVEILMYRAALTPFDVETVAYDAHLEYRIPVLDLPRLSLAQVRSARVIGSVGGSTQLSGSRGLTEQTSIAHLGRGLGSTVQAELLPHL